MPATCYTHTTCSALLPCTDCTLAQPLPLATANSAAYLTHSTICTTAPPQRSLATDAAAAAACLLHAHHLLCAATVHRLHSRPAPALPTANSPTCLTLYYYLYDCGSTISLLAADAATAAARALPNLRYHRLCMLPRQAPTPALPTQRVNQQQALCHAGPECVKSESVRTCARMNYQQQLIDKPCSLAVLLCCSLSGFTTRYFDTLGTLRWRTF